MTEQTKRKCVPLYASDKSAVYRRVQGTASVCNNNNNNHFHKITNAEMVLQQDKTCMNIICPRLLCAKRETRKRVTARVARAMREMQRERERGVGKWNCEGERKRRKDTCRQCAKPWRLSRTYESNVGFLRIALLHHKNMQTQSIQRGTKWWFQHRPRRGQNRLQ